MAHAYLPGGRRKSLRMAFLRRNEKLLLEELETQINQELKRFSTPDLTLQDLYERFFASKTFSITHKYKIKRAITVLTPENQPLSEPRLIREQIMKNLNSVESISTNTWGQLLKVLRQIFKYGVDFEMIERNPIIDAMIPQSTKPRFYIFTEEEINLIIDYTKNYKQNFHDLIRFVALTGVRITEACTLKYSDIEPTRIRIIGKSGRDGQKRIRYFPIDPFPKLRLLINEFLQHKHRIGTIFKYTDKRRANDDFNKVLNEIGINEEGKGFHAIRKYYENKILREYEHKASAQKFVAMLLGHTEAIQAKHYLKGKEYDELAEFFNV